MTKDQPTPPVLVGRWFHTFDDRVLKEQGQVIAQVEPGVYLVEIYEWMAGTPVFERLVTVTEMLGWWFYDSNAWMLNSYEYGAASSRVKASERCGYDGG
jgi:hypothetical protein